MRFSIRRKLTMLVVIALIPLLGLICYLFYSLLDYSNSYEQIVSNMTTANGYNLNFKEEMDESLYKLSVGAVTFDEIGESADLEDPYVLVDELREEFQELVLITTDSNSRLWLQSLLRNLDTLDERIDDIRDNLEEGGHYEENMVMLDNNIYILTELIQDDIQYYIYYQTETMEVLKDQLHSDVESTVFVFALILIAVIAGVLLFSVSISGSIIQPLTRLDAVAGKISEGDFTARVEIRNRDELGDLSVSINQMAENLGILVEQIREKERKMRQAELRLLQEQINPHFLYNTLDTIVWLIEGNNPDKAVDMVVTLSEFFRLVLSKGRDMISIRDEENHIRNYLEIQQYRYHDILSYEITIDPELYHYQIQKLTLQPLVENSLYHGIKQKRSPGTIRVTGRKDGELLRLSVADDGAGMDEATLTRLREEISRPCQETESGFGLANVNERIRMYFGADYGMTIQSETGEGTRVDITIPAVPLN